MNAKANDMRDEIPFEYDALIKAAKRSGAWETCEDLVNAMDCGSLKEAKRHPNAPYWASWLLKRVRGLSRKARKRLTKISAGDTIQAYHLLMDGEALTPKTKQKAIESVLTSPRLSFYLRRNFLDLPSEILERAEESACREPSWACHLRANVSGLSDAGKERAEIAACQDLTWAYFLLKDCRDLSPEARARAEAAARPYVVGSVFLEDE